MKSTLELMNCAMLAQALGFKLCSVNNFWPDLEPMDIPVCQKLACARDDDVGNSGLIRYPDT